MKKNLPYIVLAVLSIFLVFAYFQANPDPNNQAAVDIHAVDQLRNLNKSIDREALLLESERKLDFDRLTQSSARMLRQVEKQSVVRFADSELLATLQSKAANVEAFKTHLAVYRNSIRAGRQLLADENWPGDVQATALAAAFLSYVAFDDARARDTLKAHIDDAQRPEVKTADAIETFLVHADVAMRTKPRVSDLLAEIVSSETVTALTTLEEKVVAHYADLSAAASVWRSTLLAGVLLFAAMLFWMITQNLRKGRELHQLNNSLEEQVLDRTRELTRVSDHLMEVLGDTKEQNRTMQRMKDAINQAAEGIAILDEGLKIVFINDAYAQILETDADALLDRLHPDHELLTEGLRNESGDVLDVSRQSSLGADQSLELSIGRVQGEESDYVVVCRDHTERKQMETNLLQAQKLESIGQLASGIAHEINTPAQYTNDNVQFFNDAWEDLAPLLNWVKEKAEDDQALADICEDADLEYLEDEVPTALKQAGQGLQQIKSIVLAMKNFAHPGVDDKEQTNVNAAIEDTVTIAKNEWKYVADVKTDLCADIPEVPAVRSALNQVWLNMIVNASHAIADVVGDSGEKGEIRITTRALEDVVEIQISDTGSGMPEEIKARIFDPFFTTKGVGSGSGQGLAIAHNVITEQHGGSIQVDSAPGAGTTFRILLPRVVSEAQGAVVH